METEDFDDAFRRKIDRVEHEDVSDNEVKRIINYVNEKRGTSNKRSYLFYGGFTLMLAAIGGLLAWNIAQMREKRSLENSINLLNQEKTTNFKNNNFVVKRDTIYIKEYVQSAGNSKEIEEVQNVIQSQNKLITVLRDRLKTDKKTSVNSELYNNDLKDKNTTAVGYIRKKNDLVLLTNNPIVINDLVFQTLHTGDTTKPKSCFKNFSYQIGVGTNIADDQKSLGVLMGVDLNKHWNVSTGIHFLEIDNYNPNDKDDIHYYSNLSTITDTSLITFVGVKQTIYQVPVTISYLIPLAKKFSLLFGLGTDLDVYATQHLIYKLRQEEKSMDKKSRVSVFNNAVISIGINKEWNHFSIQLSPFVNPQITRVSYKNPESYYGGRIRLFYTF